MADNVSRAIDRAYEHLDRDEVDAAIAVLREVLDAGYEGASEAWVVMAEANRAKGDLLGAMQAAESALALREPLPPEDWPVLARSLTEYEAKPEILEAIAHALDQAAEDSPSTAGVFVARGILRLSRGHVTGALDEFSSALNLDEDNLDAWLGSAAAQERLGMAGEAAESYESAAELAPDVTDHWLAAGQAALEAGNAVLAANAFDQAIQLGSTASALPGRAKAALLLGIPADAAEDLERALDEAPENAELWELLGEARFELADDEGAAEAYRRAVDLDAGRATAWRSLGEALWNADQLQAAEDALRRAAALDPMDAEPLMSLAQLLLETGRADEAVAIAREAITLDDTAADAAVVIAHARLAAGDAAAARAVLDQAMEAAPEAAVLYLERARVLAEQGLYRLATRDVGWALDIEPAYAEATALRGRLALESGDLSAADADLADAVSLDETDGEAWVWHGRARALLGYPDDAHRAWDQAESILPDGHPLRERALSWRDELERGIVP